MILGFLACAPAPEPVVALAASSLTEAFESAGRAWTAEGNPEVVFSFDASSRLAQQAIAGAPADLFASADVAWMDELAGRGLLDGSPAVVARNALVVVVPADRPDPGPDLADVGRLALAGEAVPAGRYAREALSAKGLWEGLAGRVVSGDDVRSTLAWVARGEADAGVVYATDARVEPRVRVAFELPSGPIVYPAAALRSARRPEDARRLLAWLASPDGRVHMTNAGFLPP